MVLAKHRDLFAFYIYVVLYSPSMPDVSIGFHIPCETPSSFIK